MKAIINSRPAIRPYQSVIIDITGTEIIPLAENKTLLICKVNGKYKSMSVWISGDNVHDKMTNLVFDMTRPKWDNRFLAIAHANGDISASGSQWTSDIEDIPF